MLKILFLSLFLFPHPVFAEQSVIKVVPVNNRTATDLHSIIDPLLENSERITASRASLIIKATPARQEQLKKIIQQLDTRLSNLSITVLQSRTKTAEKLNLHINRRKQFLTNHVDFISSRKQGRFAQTEGFNNSDITQEIKTLEGRPAYIKTGKTYPVQDISLYDSRGNDYPIISSNTRLIEASTGFVVTPHLTGSQQVSLEISPWSDKMNNNGTIDTQQGHSTLRVNLGEWIEITSSHENRRLSRDGTLSHSYSTVNKSLRILLKVEKL